MEEAVTKAEAQILFCSIRLEELYDTTPYLAHTQEMIDGQIRFYKKEQKIWTFILTKIQH